MSYCPSCQAPVAPYDQFCQKCGARLAPAYYPYYPPVAPRPEDHTALIVVIVVVLVILTVAVPAILYVMVSRLITSPDGTPRAIGIAITRSSDGATWILTFTSVPTGTTPSGTTLTLISAGGSTMLPATALYQLEGAGMSGVRYVPVTMGTTYCSAGDQILAAAGSGANQYPAGTRYMIMSGGSFLASGTIQ